MSGDSDISQFVKDRCTLHHDLNITSDGMGFFGYKQHLNSYVEVISYDRFGGDGAQSRLLRQAGPASELRIAPIDDIRFARGSRAVERQRMHIDIIRIENFRTFRRAEIDLLHTDRKPADLKERFGIDVLYPNINLVLGNNGMDKSAFLKAIAVSCLGPTVRDSGIFPYRFVRREPGSAEVAPAITWKLNVPGKPIKMPSTRSLIKSEFVVHPQDGVANPARVLVSSVRIDRRGDLETLMCLKRGGQSWDASYEDERDAFFFVGYGASRRAEARTSVDYVARRKTASVRAQRLRSLFQDDATLIPLSSWFPQFAKQNATAAKRAEAQGRIDRYKSAKSQHANCARSFERLFIADRIAAEACFKAADDYLESKS
jgi:hypothetical protein